MHPVLTSLPFAAGRGRTPLPVGPHHAVPAINLGGIILERTTPADPALAETMYRGIFDFAGQQISARPDDVFAKSPPSREWQAALLRFDWLASFRASPKSLHGLFALRLVSAWVSARPHYNKHEEQITALYNLAVDAAAIAATQSPAAIAIATAAILQAQHPVQRLKAVTPDETVARLVALLAAHLATKRPESQRSKLVQDLADALQQVIAGDGSHLSGDVSRLHALQEKLLTLAHGLALSGEPAHPQLHATTTRIAAFLALLARPDRSLAFVDDASLRLPLDTPQRRDTVLAEIAGHARMLGGKTLLLANFGAARDTRSLQLEIHDGEHPLLWLEKSAATHPMRREGSSLICAAGGSLLELTARGPGDTRHHLALFLSGDGSDIRLEETPGEGPASTYLLHVPDQAKLSTTHGGTGAMIVSPAASAWQVLVRGGHIETESGFLRVIPGGPSEVPLNFALKRINQSERVPRPTKSGRAAAERAMSERSPRLL